MKKLILNIKLHGLNAISEMILFVLYLIARVIKSVLFWTPIDVYVLWKHDTNQRNLEAGLIIASMGLITTRYFFGWIGILVLILVYLSGIVYAFYQLNKLTKNDLHSGKNKRFTLKHRKGKI